MGTGPQFAGPAAVQPATSATHSHRSTPNPGASACLVGVHPRAQYPHSAEQEKPEAVMP